MSVADTCFLIDLLREDPGAMQLADGEEDLSTTAISAAEFLYGACRSGRPAVEEVSRVFLSHFTILPFDKESAEIYAALAAQMHEEGYRLSSFDELIAATVIRHKETLLTRDTHFSMIPGVQVRSY